MYRFLCLAAAVFFLVPSAVAQYVRPGKEVRTINTDVYEISVQKNGRTDINLTTREVVFENAFPMIQIDGDAAPRPLKVDGRFSTRTEVNDRLGKGHGLLLARDGCEWLLQAYPTKPFFTVQLSFTNTTRNPVRVARLYPWCVGSPREGLVRIGPVAQEVAVYSAAGWPASPSRLENGRGASPWMLAALSPGSGRSLIAGFLSGTASPTEVILDRSEQSPDDGFDIFQSVCIYNPPVELKPGERLQAELLYVSVGEVDPLLGLERFAKATAVVNGVHESTLKAPCGWIADGTAVTAASLLAEAAVFSEKLQSHGWSHITIAPGWDQLAGDWTPDGSRFPEGFAPVTRALHDRGLKAGLSVNPFVVHRESNVARFHPEWLLNDAADAGLAHLDPRQEAVGDYLRQQAERIRQEWGFDTLVLDHSPALLADTTPGGENGLDLAGYRAGLQALRDGFGRDGFVISSGSPQVDGLFADGVRMDIETAPAGEDRWQTANALSATIGSFYAAPHLCLLDAGTMAYPNAAMGSAAPPSIPQQLVWLTGAALAGGTVSFAGLPSRLGPDELAMLKKLLPVADKPARPVDLFQESPPRIWHLPLRTDAGSWHILGLFNWNASESTTIRIPMGRLGLSPQEYFTVFDFWGTRFYGVVQGELQIEIPAGSVRVIGLRPYEEHPMFVAQDSHFAQGALEYRQIEWSDTTNTLRGSFSSVDGTRCTVYVHVPAGFHVREVLSGGRAAEIAMEGPLLKFFVSGKAGDALDWEVHFDGRSANAR